MSCLFLGVAGEAVENKEETKSSPVKPAAPKCIVVPIVLKMADVDHQTLLEEWIACRAAESGNSTTLEVHLTPSLF